MRFYPGLSVCIPHGAELPGKRFLSANRPVQVPYTAWLNHEDATA